MKVLHIIDSLGVGGGAEHSLAAILPVLSDRGVESSIATIRPRGFGLEVALAGQGFDIEVLPSTSWPGRVRALRRKIHVEKPDVVHATLFNSCMIARLANIGIDIPLVNTLALTSYDSARLQGIDAAQWKLKLVKAIDGLSGRHLVDGVHAVTGAVRKEAVEQLRFDPDKVTVIPRGRSVEKLGTPSAERRTAVREQLGFSDDRPLLLNAARQVHQKAQDQLIKAFAKVLVEVPDAVLLIAGREGDASAEVQQALSEVNVGDSIRLLGHRDDVADLLAAADIFVFPSLYEGMAGTVLEAMALATPVVGSDAVAIAEVLDYGRFGPVVPRGDLDALAVEITKLLQDPERRAALGAAGRDHFLHTYQIETVADSMIEMYSSLIATRNH